MRPNQPLSMSDMVVVKSSCDVRALTYCDLKLLHIPGIVEVLWLYPDFKDKFAEDIIHDLTYNLREGYVVEVSSTALPTFFSVSQRMLRFLRNRHNNNTFVVYTFTLFFI